MHSGTHYSPITTERTDIGEGLTVSGRVLEAGSCRPLPHAKIAHWQASREGYYTDRLRAFLYSGADGEYRFDTEWPAAMVPHIHFIVSAPGHRTLTTQWVGSDPVEAITVNLALEPLTQGR